MNPERQLYWKICWTLEMIFPDPFQCLGGCNSARTIRGKGPFYLVLFLVNFTKNWSYDQILVIFTKNWSRNQFQLSLWQNFSNFYQKLVMQPIPIVITTKFWSFLPKIFHVTNSKCHCDQILLIFNKNWSCDKSQLSSWPNFGHFFQKLVLRHGLNLDDHHQGCLYIDQIQIVIIKYAWTLIKYQ